MAGAPVAFPPPEHRSPDVVELDKVHGVDAEESAMAIRAQGPKGAEASGSTNRTPTRIRLIACGGTGITQQAGKPEGCRSHLHCRPPLLREQSGVGDGATAPDR